MSVCFSLRRLFCERVSEKQAPFYRGIIQASVNNVWLDMLKTIIMLTKRGLTHVEICCCVFADRLFFRTCWCVWCASTRCTILWSVSASAFSGEILHTERHNFLSLAVVMRLTSCTEKNSLRQWISALGNIIPGIVLCKLLLLFSVHSQSSYISYSNHEYHVIN